MAGFTYTTANQQVTESNYRLHCVPKKPDTHINLQEQFDQMALILVDVCERYWP